MNKEQEDNEQIDVIFKLMMINGGGKDQFVMIVKLEQYDACSGK